MVLLCVGIESIEENVERGKLLAPSHSRKYDDRQRKEGFHPCNAKITSIARWSTASDLILPTYDLSSHNEGPAKRVSGNLPTPTVGREFTETRLSGLCESESLTDHFTVNSPVRFMRALPP